MTYVNNWIEVVVNLSQQKNSIIIHYKKYISNFNTNFIGFIIKLLDKVVLALLPPWTFLKWNKSTDNDEVSEQYDLYVA
jgi:hypothetical protein